MNKLINYLVENHFNEVCFGLMFVVGKLSVVLYVVALWAVSR